MSRTIRYQLGFELHHLESDDDEPDNPGIVVTVRRWDVVNPGAGRTLALHVILENGVETMRFTITDQHGLDDLNARLARLHMIVNVLTDDEARAEVQARTGIEHGSTCHVGECGAPRPIGSDRCAVWHAAGTVGRGNLGTSARRPPIVMGKGGEQ